MDTRMDGKTDQGHRPQQTQKKFPGMTGDPVKHFLTFAKG